MFGHFDLRGMRTVGCVVALAVSVAACSGARAPASAAPPVRTSVQHSTPTVGRVEPAVNPACAAPALIAHRGDGGASAAYPENTSAAELYAAAHGATVLDVDVQWTSDDVPVAIHDGTLNRTTTGTGPVLDVTAAKFLSLLSRNNNGTVRKDGLHPQTLAQLLNAIKGTDLPIIVQMEADPFHAGRGEASIESLAQVITLSGYAARVTVAGWTVQDVRAFESADPGVRTALLAEEPTDPSAAEVKAAGTDILYIDYRLVTAKRMAAWRAGGIVVWAWTPPFSSQWAQLKKVGVDAIATNWVPSYVHWEKPCKLNLASS